MYAEYIKLREKLIKKIRPERFGLPGYDPENREKNNFIGWLAFSVFISLVFFVGRYSNARDRLYYKDYETGEKFLWDGAIMTDFADVLGWSLAGLFLTAAICLSYIIIRYNYLNKESKSIYLMRRLPKRGELWRRCAAAPLLRAAICLVFAFVLLLLYFAIYMIATPDQCLAPDQWAKIWR